MGKAGKSPLVEAAYEQIYQKITTFEFEPGQLLEEKKLVEEINIGRTPIREALLRLVNDMMVESYHNKGFVVRPILLQNTKAVFESLRIFEHGVADLAVRHEVSHFLGMMSEANQEIKKAVENNDIMALAEANQKYHMNFAFCSYNEYLIQALKTVRYEAKRLAFLSYSHEINSSASLKTHYISVTDEHEGIIQAIESRDATLIKEIIDQHIKAFQQRIILYLTS